MKRSISNLTFKNMHAIQFDSLCEEIESPPKDPISLRRCLQNRFDSECPYSLPSRTSHITNVSDTSVWPSLSSLTINFNPNPRRMLRSSANKLTRSFGNLRTTLEEFSQKFRASTRRHHRLTSSPVSPHTPHSRTRKILGRTPTKLYSPFAIVTPSPKSRTRYSKENVPTPKRNVGALQRRKPDQPGAKKSGKEPSENKPSLRQKLVEKN